MLGSRVTVDLVRVEEELLRTELALVPHDVGHVLLDVAVLCLVQSDVDLVDELGVTSHGRDPDVLLADLTPVLAAVDQVVAVQAGALHSLQLLAVEVFYSAE